LFAGISLIFFFDDVHIPENVHGSNMDAISFLILVIAVAVFEYIEEMTKSSNYWYCGIQLDYGQRGSTEYKSPTM
jgi:hypothetical protein